MQLRAFYNVFLDELKPMYGYDEAVAISNLIFEETAAISRAMIIAEPEKIIADEKLIELEAALLQLKKYTPPQYIIGRTWFYGLRFKVSPAVLIPRPETEELVQEVIRFMQAGRKKTFIDIGTGSGCIPISVKRHIPEAEAYAIDVSSDALALAKENATVNHTMIRFSETDFLDETQWNLLPNVDVIISNPPYIPLAEKQLLESNVAAHEPSLALFVPDNDPLLFYKKIAAFGKLHLNAGGSIFMETHMEYAVETARHFESQGYHAIVKKDIFEKGRMVIATLYR
ncbi:MAG: peptide chain release factor N(5)-glutamine methyltransferase [Ferruginibacter sp.]